MGDGIIEDLLARTMPDEYVTHFLDDGPESREVGFELVRLLRDGEVVALQGDRPRAGGRTVTAPLFGRPFDFPAGPGLLSHAGLAPLLPVWRVSLATMGGAAMGSRASAN